MTEDKAVYAIVYDDADVRHEIVIGEKAARARFARISDNWNAHLFGKLESNSRDDSRANDNVTLATPAPAQPEPTAEQIREWRHKADQYDSIVKAVEAADGGKYRADTISALLSRIREVAQEDEPVARIERRFSNKKGRFEHEVVWLVDRKVLPLGLLYLRPSRAAAPAEGAAWQDIETAPKDGRIVLYWVASARFQEDDETGQLREVDVSAADFGCWKPGGVHGEGYHDPFGGIPGDQGGVTHWMPSPPPPAAPKEKP